MRMYKASFGWNYRIEPIDVSRVTEKSIFILVGTFRDGKKNEQASRIESEGVKYFDTWEEAHKHILRIAEDRLDAEANKLKALTGEFEKVKAMKNEDIKQ